MSHMLFSICSLKSQMRINANMLSNDDVHTSITPDCPKPFKSAAEESSGHHMHHRLMKQTQHKLQIVFNNCCLRMTWT